MAMAVATTVANVAPTVVMAEEGSKEESEEEEKKESEDTSDNMTVTETKKRGWQYNNNL